jgi:hypothetical protein
VQRLSRASVTKRFDAYRDVDWDHPDNRIVYDDPRWELNDSDTLGGTAWYRGLPQATRARLGLHIVVSQMKLGAAFENILSRGLLELAAELPNRSPEYRYAYHEVIEEGQHSLMFQEFVNRSGLDVRGLGPLDAWTSRRIPRLGRRFPELFFLFVLGGEAPIDHEQRAALRGHHSSELHPLFRRIMQIHVTEEARHLCFADAFLRERVPQLSGWRKRMLQLRAPLLFKAMSLQMLKPPGPIVREYGIPRAVLREAYRDNPHHRAKVIAGLASVRELCADIGVVTPQIQPLWMWLGLWPSIPQLEGASS